MKDVAAANAYFASQSAATGIFNVAYGNKITINELCRTICQLTGSTSAIRHASERAGDVKHSLAAVGKLQGAGFTAQGSLSDGLKATVDFFKAVSRPAE